MKPRADGFTIIEVLVTLVVTALFLTVFFQAYLVVEAQRLGVARRAKASDMAYSNLRKFTVRPSTLTCDAATMDLTASDAATKTGKLLGDETNTTTSSAYGFIAEPTGGTVSLGADTKQKVVAYAPQGCSDFANSPIKIVSTVTYGGDTIVHASYVQ